MMPPHRSTTSSASSSKQYSNQQIQSNQKIMVDQQPIQQPGHHREIIDKIRNDLKPFEQQERQEIQVFQMPSTSCPVNNTMYTNRLNDRELQMINQLTQHGFDKVSF